MRRCLVAAVLLALVLPAPARSQAVAAGRYPQAVALATFDSAWSRIRDTHYDTAFNGVDWRAVRDELRPRAAGALSIEELRAVLRDMLGRLGESHFGLIPGEAVRAIDPAGPGREEEDGPPGDLGLELRLVEGRIAVLRVDAAGPAAAAGVRPGWVLRSIGDFKTGPAIRDVLAIEDEAARRTALTQLLFRTNARLEGTAGSRVGLDFLDGEDQSRPVLLARRPRPGQPVRFGNLPTFFARLSHERIGGAGDCVGMIRFNVWMVPLAAEFDRALDSLRGCRGIVIDLRGNPGGVAGMVMGVAGHFFAQPTALGTMRSRTTRLNFVANPRRVSARAESVEPFAGPLAILIDPLSVSTSEIFAGGLQAVGRARVFGENSAGQALPATLLRLPSGDVLMHVVADFSMPGGVRIEGRGVRPDEEVPLRRSDLLAGKDASLDAAVRWIRASAGGVTS